MTPDKNQMIGNEKMTKRGLIQFLKKFQQKFDFKIIEKMLGKKIKQNLTYESIIFQKD